MPILLLCVGFLLSTVYCRALQTVQRTVARSSVGLFARYHIVPEVSYDAHGNTEAIFLAEESLCSPLRLHIRFPLFSSTLRSLSPASPPSSIEIQWNLDYPNARSQPRPVRINDYSDNHRIMQKIIIAITYPMNVSFQYIYWNTNIVHAYFGRYY